MSTEYATLDTLFDVDNQDLDAPLDIPYLAKLWGKQYIKNLVSYAQESGESDDATLPILGSPEQRAHTANKLLKALNFASAQAWSKTESLLSVEVQRHGINPQHIDPWGIARDSYHLFEKVLSCYQAGKPPRTLATVLGPECGRVRQAATNIDPRLLGFVSMQIHYTGEILLDSLPLTDRTMLGDYFKVLDDHLYMPLHRAYASAAKHADNSPALMAVQALLPQTSQIARQITQSVGSSYASHTVYTGSLQDSRVRTSSTRDVSMFQIYLCVCVLEGSIAAFQEELFPLCVMLYPPLKVDWWLVRLLVDCLDEAINSCLSPEHTQVFQPYIHIMHELFGIDVLGDRK